MRAPKPKILRREPKQGVAGMIRPRELVPPLRATILGFSLRTAVVASAFLMVLCAANAQSDDQASIAKLLHGMFDRPDMQVTIAPVVVSGDYAIAGWTQAEAGGRALLRKKEQQWSLILCAGDEIKSAHALITAGIIEDNANTLHRDLATAESALPKEQVAMFSRFQGIMMMDGSGEHSHHHPHDHNGQP
jgi:hypothetical protein